MIWASTKELYAMFLESDWWRELSRRKKTSVGRKCEKCGAKKRLTSHHLRYPANWFDTVPADLQVLCWPCHQKTHDDKPQHQAKKRKKRRHRIKNVRRPMSNIGGGRKKFLAHKETILRTGSFDVENGRMIYRPVWK